MTERDAALALVLTDGWYPPSAILWRTEFLRSIGGWGDFRGAPNDDGELVARALLLGALFSTASGAGAVDRQHGSAGRVSGQQHAAAFTSSLLIGSELAGRLATGSDLVRSRRDDRAPATARTTSGSRRDERQREEGEVMTGLWSRERDSRLARPDEPETLPWPSHPPKSP